MQCLYMEVTQRTKSKYQTKTSWIVEVNLATYLEQILMNKNFDPAVGNGKKTNHAIELRIFRRFMPLVAWVVLPAFTGFHSFSPFLPMQPRCKGYLTISHKVLIVRLLEY